VIGKRNKIKQSNYDGTVLLNIIQQDFWQYDNLHNLVITSYNINLNDHIFEELQKDISTEYPQYGIGDRNIELLYHLGKNGGLKRGNISCTIDYYFN